MSTRPLDSVRLLALAAVALSAVACALLASLDGAALPVGAVFLVLVIAAGLARVYRYGEIATAIGGSIAYGVLESGRGTAGIETWVAATACFAGAGGLAHLLERAMAREEAARHHLQVVVRELTVHDEASGVMKQRYGELAIEDEVRRSRRTGAPVTLVVVAPDPVPDHPVEEPPDPDEDAALIGAVFRERLRVTDRVARLSESTFVAILPATPSEGGLVVAEKLSRSAEERGSRPLRCGIATFPDNAVSTADLLEEALAALYLARAGKLPNAGPQLLTME